MLASKDFRKEVRGVREVTPVAESKIKPSFNGVVKTMSFTCDASGTAPITYTHRDKFMPLIARVTGNGVISYATDFSINPLYGTSGTFRGVSSWWANKSVTLFFIELT